MKKIIFVALVLGMAYAAPAQVTKTVKKDAKAVGHKTAEVASKTAAKIADQKIDDKTAANGENVYVNGHGKYYWIDKKGHKHYVKESSLKPKS